MNNEPLNLWKVKYITEFRIGDNGSPIVGHHCEYIATELDSLERIRQLIEAGEGCQTKVPTIEEATYLGPVIRLGGRDDG